MFKKIHGGVKFLSNKINKLAKFMVVFLVGFLVIIVLLQVVFRYILNTGLPWVDELSRYLNIWVAFLGASIGVKYGKHAKVSFFVNLLPAKIRNIYILLTDIFMFVFINIILYLSVHFVINSNSVTPTMRIPFKLPKAAIFVGMIFISVHIIEYITNDLVNLFSEDKNLFYKSEVIEEINDKRCDYE